MVQLEKRNPEDQFAQFVEVPSIRAALALNHGDTVAAITYLERAKLFDRADPSARLGRADTLLRAGLLNDAASEYESVASFPFGASVEAGGSLWPCSTVNLFGPLADVGLARSRRLAGDISGSRRAYHEFFAAWRCRPGYSRPAAGKSRVCQAEVKPNDHTHAALTQPADDLVVPNNRANSRFIHFSILPVQAECSKVPVVAVSM